MSEANKRPDFKSIAKEKGLLEPTCRFCDSYDFTFDKMPDGAHIGLPVYHIKGQRGAHLGSVLRVCTTCGHAEVFLENRFRKYLGLDPFVHAKKKKS